MIALRMIRLTYLKLTLQDSMQCGLSANRAGHGSVMELGFNTEAKILRTLACVIRNLAFNAAFLSRTSLSELTPSHYVELRYTTCASHPVAFHLLSYLDRSEMCAHSTWISRPMGRKSRPRGTAPDSS